MEKKYLSLLCVCLALFFCQIQLAMTPNQMESIRTDFYRALEGERPDVKKAQEAVNKLIKSANYRNLGNILQSELNALKEALGGSQQVAPPPVGPSRTSLSKKEENLIVWDFEGAIQTSNWKKAQEAIDKLRSYKRLDLYDLANRLESQLNSWRKGDEDAIVKKFDIALKANNWGEAIQAIKDLSSINSVRARRLEDELFQFMTAIERSLQGEKKVIMKIEKRVQEQLNKQKDVGDFKRGLKSRIKKAAEQTKARQSRLTILTDQLRKSATAEEMAKLNEAIRKTRTEAQAGGIADLDDLLNEMKEQKNIPLAAAPIAAELIRTTQETKDKIRQSDPKLSQSIEKSGLDDLDDLLMELKEQKKSPQEERESKKVWDDTFRDLDTLIATAPTTKQRTALTDVRKFASQLEAEEREKAGYEEALLDNINKAERQLVEAQRNLEYNKKLLEMERKRRAQ